MAKKKAREGYKHRKHGRNRAFCLRYRAENREAKNKARNIAREKERQRQQ